MPWIMQLLLSAAHICRLCWALLKSSDLYWGGGSLYCCCTMFTCKAALPFISDAVTASMAAFSLSLIHIEKDADIADRASAKSSVNCEKAV